MKYVILADGTRIDNCNDSTTSNSIFAVRDSYAEASAVRDLFNKDNAKLIRVYDEMGRLTVVGNNLILLDDVDIEEKDNKCICEIKTRIKNDLEKLQDEINVLQDIVIE